MKIIITFFTVCNDFLLKLKKIIKMPSEEKTTFLKIFIRIHRKKGME